MAKKKILCAVQMHWKVSDYQSKETFERKIGDVMSNVEPYLGSNTDALVVFPEDVGTPLVFMTAYPWIKNAKTIVSAIKLLYLKYFLKICYYGIRYKAGLFRAIALARAEDIAGVYIDVFSKTAKKYNVYLVAGSVLLPDFQWNREVDKIVYKITDNKVYNMAFLFDPDGNITGIQKKVHLVPDLEDKGGFDLCEGSIEQLKTFDTPLGKIGIAICLDCFKEPVINVLAKKGAKILVQPSANCKVWNKEEQEGWMEGCWKAMNTEKSFRYALNPMMTGCLFDLCFEGQSSILSNTDNNEPSLGYKDLEYAEGFIRLSNTHTKEEILFFEIP